MSKPAPTYLESTGSHDCTKWSRARVLSAYPKQLVVRARSEDGAVLLEFVLAFPLFLVLTLVCLQFSHLWIAKLVVHYGAYCAARSALVCTESQYQGDDSGPSRAARIVCGLLGQSWPVRSRYRTTTTITTSEPWNVKATTTHTFSLVVPVAAQILGWGMNPWDDRAGWSTPGRNASNTDAAGANGGFPTVTLRESVVLPKPYVRMDEAIFPR